MISSIGGFNLANYAVSIGLSRQEGPTDPLKPSQSDKTSSAKDAFLEFMKKTPAQRMVDAWLNAHGLTKEKLDKMSTKEQEAVMKQMKDDIERTQSDQANSKARVDILA